jgi:hypothetical protein
MADESRLIDIRGEILRAISAVTQNSASLSSGAAKKINKHRLGATHRQT